MPKFFAAVISSAILLGCGWSETGTTSQQLPVAQVEQAPVASQSQATTTSTSSTSSTTTTVPLEVQLANVDFAALRELHIAEARAKHGPCGEWYETAIDADWPAEDWPRLSRIMYRESRCTIDAWNGRVPADQWKPNSNMGCPDAGLVQINCIHRDSFTQLGWSWPADAFNPILNLHFAAMLYDGGKGCKHWRWLDCSR